MLLLFSGLFLRRPRFPEGEFVPWKGIGFVGANCAFALAASLALAGQATAHHWQAIALLTVVAALTPFFTVYGPQFTVYDTAAVFVVAAAFLASPPVAALVGLPACLVDAVKRRTSVVSLAHNSATIALAALTTSLLAQTSSTLSSPLRAAVFLPALCAYAGI